MPETPTRTARANYSGPPATLADHAREGFKLTPICRRCWHQGTTVTPAEVADRFAVPMTIAVNQVASRLVCRPCGAREGYFHLENPHVRSGGRPARSAEKMGSE